MATLQEAVDRNTADGIVMKDRIEKAPSVTNLALSNCIVSGVTCIVFTAQHRALTSIQHLDTSRPQGHV